MNWGYLILLTVIGIWIYRKIFSPSPEFPPLETDPDDPLILEAMDKAMSTFAQFRELFLKHPDDAFVKLKFESNTGVIEHLGANVESINGNELSVLLVRPPVTHNEKLERKYICSFDDIEDWQVTDVEGNIYGGYTQRVMFEIARNIGVSLPKELQELETKYVQN